MSFNLLVHHFAPFRTASGATRWLRVADLNTGLPDGDYAVEPDWPRPDLNIATLEFLIGVLSIAMAPASYEAWKARWRVPPSPEEIEAALSPLLPAFSLSGDGPRFLQERGIAGEANPIEALFIDTPGANGRKKNADLLTHRARYPALGLPAAAMALYALQAWAPAGGAGNNTSMRGGGPLTALAVPGTGDLRRPASLWAKVWANVALRRDPPPTPDKLFPWLTDKPFGGQAALPIAQSDLATDPLHAFFGMPRRLMLVFAEHGTCALTGREGPVATGFIQRPNGLKYGEGWQHPLTPYRRLKPMEPPYSAKPKAGRFGFREWVAATLGDGTEGDLRIPAANVKAARSAERADALSANWAASRPRIRVAGWAMNNMEAMAYLVAEEPLHLARPADAYAFDDLARRLADAGDLAHGSLRGAVVRALYSRGEKPDTAKGLFDGLRNSFFERADDAFHDVLNDALAREPFDADAPAQEWLRLLRRLALDLFDRAAPAPLDDAEKAADVVKGRSLLLAVFAGRTKDGKALFAKLKLPLPEKAPRAKEPA